MTSRADGARPRAAAGPERPRYLAPDDIDKVMAILLALVSEVAAIRERVDTHERLAEQEQLPAPAAIEAYRPDAVADGERMDWHRAFIRRLFRVVAEEVDLAREHRPSAGETGDLA